MRMTKNIFSLDMLLARKESNVTNLYTQKTM